jgi:hypothetical protein
VPVLHEPVLDPLYVPVIDVEDVVPFPETVDEHPAYGASKPPVGTESENCSDDPETVPETVPRPVTLVLLSVMVSDPENDDPDCVICHVIVPGPEESEAVPVQVPLTLAGEDGSVGLEPPPPPQPAATPRANAKRRQATRRRVREVDKVFICRMQMSVPRLGCRGRQIVGGRSSAVE